jgi:hypothetical protein
MSSEKLDSNEQNEEPETTSTTEYAEFDPETAKNYPATKHTFYYIIT